LYASDNPYPATKGRLLASVWIIEIYLLRHLWRPDWLDMRRMLT